MFRCHRAATASTGCGNSVADQATEKPATRRVNIVVTDTEWRAVRIAAAARDQTVQGYVTDAVLGRLQGPDAAAMTAASDGGGGGK